MSFVFVLDLHNEEQQQTIKTKSSNDLILIDQKGSGESKPSLDCWEIEEDLTEEAISACKRRLSLKGIDFSSYQIRGIAEDIVDLRNVLGIKKWNLYGVSFGSRIALELLAIDQAAVNSVVLDSPLKHFLDPFQHYL